MSTVLNQLLMPCCYIHRSGHLLILLREDSFCRGWLTQRLTGSEGAESEGLECSAVKGTSPSYPLFSRLRTRPGRRDRGAYKKMAFSRHSRAVAHESAVMTASTRPVLTQARRKSHKERGMKSHPLIRSSWQLMESENWSLQRCHPGRLTTLQWKATQECMDSTN